MKICVYGAGAIGGLLCLRLSEKGEEVSVVDVGPTLGAIRKHGIRVQTNDRMAAAEVRATDDAATLGPQDLVIIAVKGPVLRQIAVKIAPLLGPDTIVLTAMNGVPWWFFQGFSGDYVGLRLDSIDPDGVIATAIPVHRLLGCVIHLSCRSIEPGLVQHVSGNRLIIGEAGGGYSPRLHTLGSLLADAGFEASVSPSIQKDIWYKLLGNMAHNPISALTGATVDRIVADSLVNGLCLDVMREAMRVGERFGCIMTETVEERIASVRELGAFKTSMLQDVEARKGVELDALIGVVCEIARKFGEETPAIDALYGLARLHARGLGLYPPDAGER